MPRRSWTRRAPRVRWCSGARWAAWSPFAFAAAHPERTAALVLVNSMARVTHTPDYPWGVPADVLVKFQEDVQSPDRDDQGIDDITLLAPSMTANQAFRSWWKRAGQQGAGPAIARAQILMLGDVDLRPVLPDLTVRTLIVHRREPAGARSPWSVPGGAHRRGEVRRARWCGSSALCR